MFATIGSRRACLTPGPPSLRISPRPARVRAVVPMSQARTNPDTIKSAILFQAFGWESCKQGSWWTTIAEKAQELADAGVTHVWLPPASHSVSREGYLPSQLYNFNSHYGSQEQLQACISALKAAGVAPVADCVYNHRCGDEQNEKGEWLRFSAKHQPGHVATIAWDESAVTSDDPEFAGKGAKDTGDDFHAAPDLDHTNATVQAGLKDLSKYLIEEMGFEGIRFDYSKGYGGSFAGDYARAALGECDGFVVGEYWVPLQYDDEGDMVYDQEPNRKEVTKWIDDTGGRCLAFDFATKGILQDAIRFNKYHWLADKKKRPHGLIGTRPEQSVTFIDNHDTGSTQRHWPFPRLKKLVGYAYVMTHPGVPSVFWEHFFEDSADLKDGIKGLLELRAEAGIVSDSKVDILSVEPKQYIADVHGRHKTVRVKLGPKRDMGKHEADEGEGWAKAMKGGDFCIWTKAP